MKPSRNQLSVITDMGSSTTDTNRQTLHVYIAEHRRLCLPFYGHLNICNMKQTPKKSLGEGQYVIIIVLAH